MKTSIYLLLLFLFNFAGEAKSASDSRVVFSYQKANVIFDKDRGVYLANDPLKKKTIFQLHEFYKLRKWLDDHSFAGKEYQKKLKDLESFHLIQAVTKPNSEMVIQGGFAMKDDALDVIENPPGGNCQNGKYFKKRAAPLDIKMKLGEADGEEYLTKMDGKNLESEGFFKLGDIEGLDISWTTGNDNLLHGVGQALGASNKKPYEGDDSGFTFSNEVALKAKFEKGEIGIRHYSNGYSRRKPQPYTYSIGGQEYTTYYSKDSEGRIYQEFLSIDGVEFEVKRNLGDNSAYLKLAGKVETLSDQSGVSLRMQEWWHKAWAKNHPEGVLYNSVDYRDDETRVSANAYVGKTFKLKESPHFRVSTDLSAGAQVSSGGNNDSYIGANARLIIDSNKWGKGTSDAPSVVFDVATDGKHYLDNEQDVAIDLGLKTRFFRGDHGNFYFETRGGYSNDRYSRDYGQREMDNQGRLDFQYFYKVGYEYRF